MTNVICEGRADRGTVVRTMAKRTDAAVRTSDIATKEKLVQIRVLPEEHAEWTEAAQAERMTLSAWARQALNKAAARRRAR